jgi:hypothetical protein
MTRTRPSASLVIATAFTGAALSLTLVVPIARADSLDSIRAAVNNKRSGTPCAALNYNIDLEGEAQHSAGNDLPGVPPAGNYKGQIYQTNNTGDPISQATERMIRNADGALNDCKYKDFGVGFVRRNDSYDIVSIALGVPASPPPPKPAEQPAEPPKPVEPPKAAGGTVNAGVDGVELYDVPGGSGTVIGNLDTGDNVTFNGPCPMKNPNNADDPTNGWCKITDTTKNLTGAVWGEFISK